MFDSFILKVCFSLQEIFILLKNSQCQSPGVHLDD